MNAERNTAPNQTRQRPQQRPPQQRGEGRPISPAMGLQGKRPDPRLLARLRAAMVIVGSMILLVGMLLVVLPLFKVNKIEVSGIEYYKEEQILEVVGLNVGDEMLAINLNSVRDALLSNFDHIDSVTVRSVFPGTVKIEIVEKKDVAYTLYNGRFYSFDSNYLVLDVSDNEAQFSSYARVELPEVVSLVEGSNIQFVNSETDMGYIFDLVEEMRKAELLPYVTLLDCARKYSNAVELNGNCRIEVGKVSQIPSKLELAQSILVSKGLAEGQCVVLDVSDLQKSTYRVIDPLEFLSLN